MVLPLSILKAGKGHPALIELKSGETYSGILASCDTFMNIHMLNAVCTSRLGDEFWRLNECFIRGNNVKSFRLPDEVSELAKDELRPIAKTGTGAHAGRGGERGRGMRGRRPHNRPRGQH
ncbi:bifunctional LSM domain [Babesia duncani]|uniref:U6 snRNA-associated Sm-like protein LSm4 n=1 Tax=Babesia duncani TaxID=323732 RepID=A0AAD9PJQ7_9APIC|nr:bifunctional LSM domain [Babesia duncani]